MALKKKLVFFLLTGIPALAAMPLAAFSQDTTDYVERAIYRKDRAVYLLDSVVTFDKADVLSDVHREDSALVGAILSKGKADEDYLGFFQRKGYHPKKIRQAEFNNLPKDTTILTQAEKRLLNEYNDLVKKAGALLSKGEMTTPLDKKMRDPKFSKVIVKEASEYPVMFILYPIYRYKNWTLVMYHTVLNRHVHDFSYTIYASPV